MIIIEEMSCHMQMLESHTRGGTAARVAAEPRALADFACPFSFLSIKAVARRRTTKGYILYSLSITWFTLEMDLLFQEKQQQEANSRASSSTAASTTGEEQYSVPSLSTGKGGNLTTNCQLEQQTFFFGSSFSSSSLSTSTLLYLLSNFCMPT